ncbi:hypothetical protein BJX68DRAFT_244636 [Aspergillus pseudodeflectus]|uniref:Uncharacterized protein n=1 Tax=Aspergillus pseudodeflectus TaxID=176178 RepID=A0ABR4JS86_9EURO
MLGQFGTFPRRRCEKGCSKVPLHLYLLLLLGRTYCLSVLSRGGDAIIRCGLSQAQLWGALESEPESGLSIPNKAPVN